MNTEALHKVAKVVHQGKALHIKCFDDQSMQIHFEKESTLRWWAAMNVMDNMPNVAEHHNHNIDSVMEAIQFVWESNPCALKA